MADKKKMSVAEMLAAARQLDGKNRVDGKNRADGQKTAEAVGELVSQQQGQQSKEIKAKAPLAATSKSGPVAKPGSPDRPKVAIGTPITNRTAEGTRNDRTEARDCL